MTGLDHPGIVHTISVEPLSEGGCVITMEDVDGTSLEDFLTDHGKLTARDVIFIGKKLCEAVEYLHGCTPPWLYCDMKPSNIMVKGKPSGIEKVVLIDIDGGIPMDLNGLLPRENYGTKDYAAPEQLHPSGSLDFRVDVYGICATLYEALHRHRVFASPDEKRLVNILKKGMSEEPADRFFTVKELRMAIVKV